MQVQELHHLGATKVLINEITSEAPNPVQELVHRLVIVVKQHLYRVLAIDGLKVWKCQFVAVLGGGIHTPQQALSLF